ncbi:MAG: cobalt ABC transporter ATP-binding protein [Candidatus Margulisiibacteriota bacterium]|nr:MAG: hypothetical protein A2X43_12290 [Candidatus Margulisbacteria bacterium GWD2_39_127]OGI03233.1 MAG: hypothetical protein A2X42_11530 [Candidatus Margulisbacteria bacterium GWF2_38_17]OGI11256.1 MAG: hypothetical protein A2X41_03955 [Candidatus Margulisbacteria bacterium GWE2_39_32]PZM78525.1 MAG: cobalt ABC transporter ATP-binding protein [Candidatus Margulisiibacteriota bacterium]HAR63909.1 cobalt ABC transporter ATP-binding protein [Candidatus Margulisiibacteriota bacterium]
MTIIKLNNVTYIYSDGNKGLSNISLEIKKGENVALMGPNGAGKSTLIYHLNGILPEKHNENIIIGELPINNKNLSEIRAKVGMLFQNSDNQLFMSSVREDIGFAPYNFGSNDIEARINNALLMTGTTHLQHKHPLHLSLGEKKLVALAGILAQQPEILVLDEPAAGLDPGQKSTTVRLLKNLTCTKIIATHELNVAQYLCQRVIILEKGKIAQDGPIDILRNTDILKKYNLLEDF